MTITPDQADRMKQAATSVPWTAHIDSSDVDEIYIYSDDGNMCIGIDLRGSYFTSHDLNLAAAAPDMAETIAGMTEKWGFELDGAIVWMNDRAMAEDAVEGIEAGRVVRQLVGPVEVVDGE